MDPLDDRLTRAGEAWREGQASSTIAWSGPPPRRWVRWGWAAGRVAGVASLVAVVAVTWTMIRPAGLGVRNVAEPGGLELLTHERPSEVVAARLPILAAADPPTGCDLAQASGRVARHYRTGLGLAADDGTVRAIRWPYGFTAEVADGAAVLRDGRGIIVAREGDRIAVGGGAQTEFFAACGAVQVLAEEPLPLLTADRPGTGFCRAALLSGTLARSDRSGLGIRGDTGPAQPVRWPFGFTATLVDGEAVLLDPAGGVAREGDQLSMGGGTGNDGVFSVCSTFTLPGRPSPAPTDAPAPVRAADTEALLDLQAGAESGDPPRIVLLAGTIGPLATARCVDGYGGRSGCEVGMIAGSERDSAVVWAWEDVTGIIDAPLDGLFAMEVGPQRLELLGPVLPSPAGAATHTVAEALDLQDPPIGTLIAVDGWLAETMRRCPMQGTATSPFEGCGGTVLASRDPERDAAWEPSLELLLPVDRYPPTLDPMLRHIPIRGTFLLQRIANDVAATPSSGWLLVGRLTGS